MTLRIIAELCQNHLGDFERVKDMASQAAEAGATHVKIQHIYTANLAFRPQFEEGLERDGRTLSIRRPWQVEHDRLRGLELDPERNADFVELVESLGAVPMTTCFARRDVAAIRQAGFRSVKVASYDCASYPLLRDLADAFDEVFVSTGATFDDEIETASRVLRDRARSFALLHCVTIYPTPLDEMHLARMDWLRGLAPLVGFSDHSLVERDGVVASLAAIALGADVVERHFTVLGARETKDGPVSIRPEHLREIADFAALDRKEQTRLLDDRLPGWKERMLGAAHRRLSHAELLNRDYYRGRFASPRPGGGRSAAEMIFNWEETPV